MPLVQPVSRDLFDINARNVKIPSEAHCAKGACFWTDSHINGCQKVEIMKKCSTSTCNWADKHRTEPACPKLEFYCNVKNNLAFIPTNVPSGNTEHQSEPRHVALKLLYVTRSDTLADPRKTRDQYPRVWDHQATCVRRDKWSVYTWSGADMVTLEQTDNPYIEQETIDEIVLL